MDGRATGGTLRFFRDLPDPRAANVVHKLHDILVQVEGRNKFLGQLGQFRGSRAVQITRLCQLPADATAPDKARSA